MSVTPRNIVVRNTHAEDIPSITALSHLVYPGSQPWNEDQLASQLRIFPEGQFVAQEAEGGAIVGMSASLVVYWDDYDLKTTWRDFTDHGMFTNHDPGSGRTLYGAEVMVSPAMQGKGVGSGIYAKRRDLVERMGLLRIRAGARLRGYHRVAGTMSPEEYVMAVIRRKLSDATLSFQLRHDFRVLGVVSGYLQHDPESLGYAAVIEWINSEVARAHHYTGQESRYQVGKRRSSR